MRTNRPSWITRNQFTGSTGAIGGVSLATGTGSLVELDCKVDDSSHSNITSDSKETNVNQLLQRYVTL